MHDVFIDKLTLHHSHTNTHLHSQSQQRILLLQYGNATNALATKYGDAINWVLVNTLEAHPKQPDPSPYRGVNWMFKYSNYSQPRNYSARVEVAQHVSEVFSLNPLFSILVDDLTPHNTSGNDPLWCSWGPAPNSAWLISRTKEVVLAQTW